MTEIPIGARNDSVVVNGMLTGIKDKLKRHLEEGTYLVHAEEVLGQVRKLFAEPPPAEGGSANLCGGKERDPELLEIALELFAGLAICEAAPGLFDELRTLLENERLGTSGKLKVTGVARSFLFDPDRMGRDDSVEPPSEACSSRPDRASQSLNVFDLLIHSNLNELQDFSTRAFLQVLSEMRVSGFAAVLLQNEDRRRTIRRLLDELSQKGWFEAGELFEFLLAEPESNGLR